MEVQIAVAKINKYASSESGDTVEVVERPSGGLSIVLADGQSSGFGAKRISTMVVRKVISLLAEGVRDGAAARAASDYLLTERKGKVQASLNILSIDMQTNTLVITRNNPAPTILAWEGSDLKYLDEESQPVGIYRNTRPVINEVPLEVGLSVIVFTDGLVHAGKRYGQPMDIQACVCTLLEENPSPQSLADSLLAHAMVLDQGRPADDISILVVGVLPTTSDGIRRMNIHLPIDT